MLVCVFSVCVHTHTSGVCSIMFEHVVETLAGSTLNKEVCFVNAEPRTT